MRATLVSLMLAVLALIGCAAAGADEGDPVPDSATLTGTVVHLERIALPPDAVLTVTLEDVSLADAPAVTLGQTEVVLSGRQSPIPFTLPYPRSAVRPGSTYAVRARITQGETLLFTTTQSYPVDALNPAPVELLVSSVPGPQTAPVPDVTLTETYWKFTEVDGNPVVVADQMREPGMVLHNQDSRLSGSGGVNRLMGGYTLAGDALSFSQVASTMMAGPPEAMAQEQVIVAALGRVRGFVLSGDQLTLVDDAGHPVLRAVAVALR
ncbi:MAG: YbaY family lipoprotein [Mycobacterium sp.]